MYDSSVIVIGDCFFVKLLRNLRNREARLPIVVAAKGASVSLLTELQTFLLDRSLLIVHLGSFDLAQKRDARVTADELNAVCRKLKHATTSNLTIIVYKLLHRRQDVDGKSSSSDICQYNSAVDVFNQHLDELLQDIVTLRLFDLDINRHHGDAGWCPNDEGNSIIAEKVRTAIEEHRRRPRSSTSVALSVPATCDTLLVGDRIFFGVRDHLQRANVGNVVIATAWSARAYLLQSIALLVGSCKLKLCVVYLGLADICERPNIDLGVTLQRLYNGAWRLWQNNHCRIVMCLLERPDFLAAGGTAQQMHLYTMTSYFNHLICWHAREVRSLGFDGEYLRRYPETVAQRIAYIIRN